MTANTGREKQIQDIALIKTKWKYGQDHQDSRLYHLNTICLPTNDTALNSNYEYATIAGWGVINSNNTLPVRLQIEDTVLFPNTRCKSGFVCAQRYRNQSRNCMVSDLGH